MDTNIKGTAEDYKIMVSSVGRKLVLKQRRDHAHVRVLYIVIFGLLILSFALGFL